MITAKAILFDLDGTLVDSTQCIESLWVKWALTHGVNVNELLSSVHGVNGADIVAKFAPWLDPNEESQKLLDLELQLVGETKLIAGVSDVIDSLKGAAWGIVTTSTKKLALSKLEVHNLPIPDMLITADDVSNTKPHPEPFLLASKKLNIPSSQCLVFEDSNAGIQSAVSANMQIIQVTRGTNTTYNSDALDVINDFREVSFSLQQPDSILVEVTS